MGWRFRKSIKILPGLRLNIGKRGVTSATVGGRWFKTNLSGRGVKHTVSAPGTGLSYQTETSGGAAGRRERRPASTSVGGKLLLVGLGVVLALALALGVAGVIIVVYFL